MKDEGNSDSEEQPIVTMKGSTRGPSGAAPKLETVQEASLPTTPSFDEMAAQRYVLLPLFRTLPLPSDVPLTISRN